MTATKSTRAATLTLLAAALVALGSPAFAENISCWPASGSTNYDQDGDGFADFFAPASARVELHPGTDFTDAEALTCPAGYVMARGDTDDSNPAVHPRQAEVGSNGIDDNSDGRIDEPTFVYSSLGYSNTTSAFSMRIKINDARSLAYAANPSWDLVARVQYQKLSDTSVTLESGLLAVTGLTVSDSSGWGYVRLAGLEAGTPYRARVQLLGRYVTSASYTRTLGVQSGWYYTMTASTYSTVQARQRIVLRALYETYLSENGYTGYLGTQQDGTRYGADRGIWWCSEFYSWVTDHELEGMGTRVNTDAMVEYFDGHSAWSELPATQTYLIGFASAGDYLGIGADVAHLVHSAMFLEYEPGRDMIWSIEGNVTGRSDVGGDYASRRGSNEARVVERASSSVAGWGLITSGMIKD